VSAPLAVPVDFVAANVAAAEAVAVVEALVLFFLLFGTPAPTAEPSRARSLRLAMVLEVSERESSIARGRAGGIVSWAVDARKGRSCG
jgi:hypothetical protein